MTDIVERLLAFGHPVMNDAAAEIERLRRLYPGEEIERLELALQQAVRDCHMGAESIQMLNVQLVDQAETIARLGIQKVNLRTEIERLRDALLAIACDPTGVSSAQADIAKRALAKTNA